MANWTGSELDVLSDNDEETATSCHSNEPQQPTSSSSSSGKGAADVAGSASAVASANSKNRRRRTAFSTHQLIELEREFQAKKYLSLTERSQIATQLRLSEGNHLHFKIKNYFFL